MESQSDHCKVDDFKQPRLPILYCESEAVMEGHVPPTFSSCSQLLCVHIQCTLLDCFFIVVVTSVYGCQGGDCFLNQCSVFLCIQYANLVVTILSILNKSLSPDFCTCFFLL